MRKFVLFILTAVAALLFISPPFASAGGFAVVEPLAPSFTLSALIVTLIGSYLIPAVVALITKSNANTWLKQFVTGLLAAVTALISTATQLDGTALISTSSILLALGSFILAQATYVSVYKPHNVNARTAPMRGLG
jgi:hypothetical protein